jgi:hypothetical protein
LPVTFGVVRGISYGLFRPPDRCVKPARALGAGLLRIYWYWSQIEPEPGRYVFDVVDHFLEQLDGTEEVWVTMCSSSTWATRRPATFLPPSPAKDAETYARFVQQVVNRCRGRVRYWQCDNEPSNIGLTWDGTAEEYVAQLKVMHRAVKSADPNALVVLGGAPFALPASAPESAERKFFDVLLRDGREAFDLFDLHLYADPERIAQDIEMVRGMMRAAGSEKPVVIGEYGSPTPEAFPRALAAIHEVMAAVFSAPSSDLLEKANDAGAGKAPRVDPPATPEQKAMQALYARMPTLPPELQMFMSGCPLELEEKRRRIQARELIVRNLQALSAGVRLTACWKLAPEVANYQDPLSIMELFYGKLLLLDYEGSDIERAYAAAKAFQLMTDKLRALESVTRIDVPDEPRLRLFDVRRRGRGRLFVVWRHGDAFDGENEAPTPFSGRWPEPRAHAIDVFGAPQPVEIRDGQLTMPISITPILVEVQ